jgi:hypothetical protein
MRFPLLCLFAILLLGSARADEPFLKKNDVIAIVGGEDMVVASEYGYLELLITRALPDYHLRFRNLAWEGDTVFEQRRDLNFPTWEEQLDKIGATVVMCEFGQMESLGGKEKLPEFIAAYEKLLDRLGGGKRRIILIPPIAGNPLNGPTASSYADAVADLAKRRGAPFVDTRYTVLHDPPDLRPDFVHLNQGGQSGLAAVALWTLDPPYTPIPPAEWEKLVPLRQLIIAKNRLWFDYFRVQNWAFLAGDRTNQPSSRDWRDPSKRWFPAEREEFLPLVEAREKEIDALAEKLK